MPTLNLIDDRQTYKGIKINTTAIDITNKKFGRLTAINKTNERSSDGGVIWKFRCECGKITFHVGNRVSRGQIISCGCARKSKNAQKSLIKSKYTDYKYSAKLRKINFNLSFEQFEMLSMKDCNYCGQSPQKCDRKFKGIFNGIDRIDNTRGYFVENTVACCKQCNLAKNDQNLKDFLNWAKRINNFQSKKVIPLI